MDCPRDSLEKRVPDRPGDKHSQDQEDTQISGDDETILQTFKKFQAVTNEATNLFNTLKHMENKSKMSSRVRPNVRFGSLPFIEEGSIESTNNGAHLDALTNTAHVAFTAIRPQANSLSKSENNSPASSMSGEPRYKPSPASHLSEPTTLQTNIARKTLAARIQQAKLEGPNASKSNPTTVGFKPLNTVEVASRGHLPDAASTRGIANMAAQVQNQPIQAMAQFNSKHLNGHNGHVVNPVGGVSFNLGNSINSMQQKVVNQGHQPMTMAPIQASTHADQAMSALQAHLARVETNPSSESKFDLSTTTGYRASEHHLNQKNLERRDTGLAQMERQLQQQQPLQQQGIHTPMRHGVMSPPYVTPSSYRYSSRSSNSSSILCSPAGPMVGGPVAQTEPRNYAPRTNNSITEGPPPRFMLPTPVPMARANVLAISHSPHQQGNGNGYSIHPFHQPQGNANTNGISPSRFGGDTFSPGSVAMVNHGGFISDCAHGYSKASLSHVIEPIEPTSTALVLHNNSVPDWIRNQRSKQLNELTAGPNQRPTAEVALHADNFPFIEGARSAQPTHTNGVVKLKNIPFATKRAEILAFLGRNSKVLNDSQEPVHIIMERVTSKTNDAYVEFMSMQAAVSAVERHQKGLANGRLARLGDRPVELELSSQAALMKDLFPLANGVRWDGPEPVILQDHPTQPWNCFKGFVTEEEMTMLVKHVEIPQRSPFSKHCPQRPFECMISTLRKFPWYMTERITIKQCHAVYTACVSLLRHLQFTIQEKKHEAYLTPQLYRRLWTSAMLCHGFTVTMKDSIAFLVGLPEPRLREFNMPRFGDMWSHTYTLAPKPGAPLDLIEWYIAIIREETHRAVSLCLPNIQNEIQKEGSKTTLYFGYIWKELPLPHGELFDNMTLAEMADREFTAISNILRRALGQ